MCNGVAGWVITMINIKMGYKKKHFTERRHGGYGYTNNYKKDTKTIGKKKETNK